MENKIIKDQFNRQAENFANWAVSKNLEYIKAYFQFCQISPNDNLLDVACGPGDFTIYSAKQNTESVGIDISDEEISKIKKILTKTTSLSNEGIDAVTGIMNHEILALSGLENYLYTREINALASKKQKEEVMLSLFLVAAADRNISAEENEEIRMIAKALGFSHSDFVEIRSLFKEHLSILRS